MRLLILGLFLFSGLASASGPSLGDELELQASFPAAADTPPRYSALAAAIEVPAINLSIWAFDRFGLDADYARISLSSVARNLRGGWTIDQDSFEVNQFGHPYQGALSYTAARSAGLDFWVSTLFPVAGSLMWEVAMETDPPSVNDQITTPLAGVLVGEALHRLTSLLLFAPGARSLFDEILAAMLNPMRAFNRHVLGLSALDDERPAPFFFGSFQTGLSLAGEVAKADGAMEQLGRVGRSLHLGVRLLHGLPGHRSLRPEKPFDYFQFDAELSLSPQPFGLLSVEGLLWGGSWGGQSGFRGLGGFYGMYDFFNPRPFRVSSAALGLGAVAVWDLGPRALLLLRGSAGFVPIGAAGLSESQELERDYHFGPGSLTNLSVSILRRGLGFVELSSRQNLLRGISEQSGWERILRVQARTELQVKGCHGLGLRYGWALRSAGFEDLDQPRLVQRGGQLGVYWVYRLGGLDGGCLRAPAPDS